MFGKKQPHEDSFTEIDEHDQPTEPMARIILSPLSPVPGEPSPAPWQNNGGMPVPGPASPQPDTYWYPPQGASPYPAQVPIYSTYPPTPSASPDKNGQVQKQARPSAFPGLVGVFFVAVQLLLLVRFVLGLFVQPGSQLSVWEGILYSASSVFLLPFRLLLQNVSLPAAIGAQLSNSLMLLLAILVYGLLSRIVVRLLKALLNTH